MKNFLKSGAVALAGLSATVTSAQAATYTYDIDYNFPILRTAVGAHSSPVAGKGSVRGTITLDDDFLTTQTLLSYNLTTTNTSGLSYVEASYNFSSADVNETFAYVAPANVWDPSIDLMFSDQSYGTPCSASSPTGARGPYSIEGSGLTLKIHRAFTPGDATIYMQAYEGFGRTAYCAAVGFPFHELEHTAPNNSFFEAGTRSANAVTPPSAVPLPAGLPLMLAGIGTLALVRRRTR